MKSKLGWFGAAWGVLGVVGILLLAVTRLVPIAQQAFEHAIDLTRALAIVASLGFFGYVEGYRAFQQQFSPRVVARAFSLVEYSTLPRLVFAPLFAMGFFGATRKRIIVSWSLTFGIILLIRLVGSLSQPWRGIIDLGVVVALIWGAVAVLAFAGRAMFGSLPNVSPDLPEAELA